MRVCVLIAVLVAACTAPNPDYVPQWARALISDGGAADLGRAPADLLTSIDLATPPPDISEWWPPDLTELPDLKPPPTVFCANDPRTGMDLYCIVGQEVCAFEFPGGSTVQNYLVCLPCGESGGLACGVTQIGGTPDCNDSNAQPVTLDLGGSLEIWCLDMPAGMGGAKQPCVPGWFDRDGPGPDEPFQTTTGFCRGSLQCLNGTCH